MTLVRASRFESSRIFGSPPILEIARLVVLPTGVVEAVGYFVADRRGGGIAIGDRVIDLAVLDARNDELGRRQDTPSAR